MLLGTAALGTTSCNDLLDLEPQSQITPDSYYTTADQLASYLNNYYSTYLVAPYSGNMYHSQGYNDGMARSDGDTDIMLAGASGNTTYFADDHWEVPSSKNLQSYYAGIRVYNYFLEKATSGLANGTISGDTEMIKNYIGEGYFFRALCYYRMLAYFGDLPIISTTLEDDNDVIVENSKRSPRNEVARFILSDLDKAAENLKDRSAFNGQRVNKQVALLFKSRVALFEATFEKYHKGSGRVPGDENWPGLKMAYNAGKSFNIDSEIDYFLTQAMDAAKQVANDANLSENTHTIQPVVGTTTGWNPYFEMFSQPSLSNVKEVLLWKQYSSSLSITHDAAYRVKTGCADGYTRTFTESFLMKDGLPIYASGNYKGDTSIDKVKEDRDERLQLFVWGESTLKESDASAPSQGSLFTKPNVTEASTEVRCITGYQPRKYYTYDYAQTMNDELKGTNACPIFRTAEALLNYIEASYLKNGSLDGTARSYWQQLRSRAGVSTDIDATIAATDLTKEGDFAVYSGTTMVDKTLYNIRRERMNEMFSEGQRFADLIRWRSFDNLMTTKWIPEGINFWEEMFNNYDLTDVKSDGSADAILSGKSQSNYLRPYSRNLTSSNELKDGYHWHEAYYLYPISTNDLSTASPTRDSENSNLYQNINWSTKSGSHALK